MGEQVDSIGYWEQRLQERVQAQGKDTSNLTMNEMQQLAEDMDKLEPADHSDSRLWILKTDLSE